MHIEIITPSKIIYSSEVERVRLPGVKGPFEILNNHAPIISTLKEGIIRVTEEGGTQKYFSVEGGLAECKSNKIMVLTEKVELLDKLG